MKRLITLGFLIATTFFGVTQRLTAQTATLNARVPFPFAVGNRVLPPGAYEIKRRGSFLGFQNQEGKTAMVLIPTPGDPSYNGRPRLLFDSRNGRYFLRKIVTASSIISVDFPKSKLEERSMGRASGIYP